MFFYAFDTFLLKLCVKINENEGPKGRLTRFEKQRKSMKNVLFKLFLANCFGWF